MKTSNLIALALMGLGLSVRGSIFYEGTPGNGQDVSGATDRGNALNATIMDGSLAGTVNQLSVSGLIGAISDITVTLNLSGGNNSDLYAYLSYGGQSVVLLNQVGVSSSTPFGNTGAGINVTLDSSSPNIHNVAGSGSLTGNYSADGQVVGPFVSGSSLSLAGGSQTLDSTFANANPNGTWTLFIADGVQGGGNETLNGWSLNISAVPEPVNVALGVFGGVFGVGALVRFTLRKRNQSITVNVTT